MRQLSGMRRICKVKVHIPKNEVVLNIDGVKKIQLQLLKYFDTVCQQQNLKYSLAYGTLLGAIRHKGYIPWDDDIDVMMPRKDFDLLVKFFLKKINDPQYLLATSFIDDDYFSPLAKLYMLNTRVYQSYGQREGKKIGVNIDIFVVDSIPKDSFIAENYYKECQKLRKEWGYSVRSIFAKHRSRNVFFDILGNLYSLFYKIRGYKFYRDKYIKYCINESFNDSPYVGVVIFGEGLLKEKMSKDMFDNLIKMKFEDGFYYCIDCYHAYLEQIYGNYMELPPLEERVSKHKSVYTRKVNE